MDTQYCGEKESPWTAHLCACCVLPADGNAEVSAHYSCKTRAASLNFRGLEFEFICL